MVVFFFNPNSHYVTSIHFFRGPVLGESCLFSHLNWLTLQAWSLALDHSSLFKPNASKTNTNALNKHGLNKHKPSQIKYHPCALNLTLWISPVYQVSLYASACAITPHLINPDFEIVSRENPHVVDLTFGSFLYPRTITHIKSPPMTLSTLLYPININSELIYLRY